MDDGSEILKELDLIRQSLKMDSPPANVTTELYFKCLEQKVLMFNFTFKLSLKTIT